MNTLSQHRALLALAAAGLVVAAAQAEPGTQKPQWKLDPTPGVVEAVPPLPPPSTYPVQLVLDDDTSDGAFGVSGQTARQFLWFNRFSPAAGFHLEEVWVLFPSGTNMAAGGAVQIAIYEDPDGDPTNGATLIASFDATIQAADGNTFSIYPVPGAPTIPTGSDLLVGVVPRFIESGVTSPTLPAALDTTATQGRSWLAVWTNDPPDPPALSPLPDQTLTLVDALVPGGGNWMIRAFGTELGVTEIPTLGVAGLAALALAILAVGFLVLARRRRASALALLLLASAVPAGAVTIDSFTINQATLTDPPGGNSIASDASADPIGQHRGLVIKNLAGAGPSSVGVAGGNLILTVTATTPDSRGEARLSWDGDLNALVLSPTGLANTDLTVGNASGFRLNFASTTVVAEVEITVYDDAANFSRAARRVPVSGSPQNVLIPFAEFRVAGGTGAVFASVGAIEITLRSGEGTVVLNGITTTAPAVAATKVDSQILDADGDGRVDPGDRVRYTVTVTNTGNEALAVDLSDTVDANTTLVPGSVSSTPVAHNDQYGWYGNVTLSADGTPFPTLLANDADADGDTLTITAFDATTAEGGTISGVNLNTGEFSYSPPPGFFGVDSFTYTVQDDNAHSATATAFIDLEGVVWFVDDSNTTPPFLGTLADPFQSLAAINGAGDADQPGDIIFVFDDDGTPYADGLVLEADQRLLGQGVGLILGGTTIVPAGGTPQITNAAGIGLALSTNNTLGGFDIQSTSVAGIFGSAFGTLAASNVNVLTAGGAALDLTTGALAATFGTLSSSGAAGQRGLVLSAVTGSLTATSTTITNPTLDGIRVVNSPGVAVNFGTTTITDTSIGAAPQANGVNLVSPNTGATFTFSSLAITADGGAGVVALNGGTIQIGGSSNTIVSTGGPALVLTSTSLGSGATFSTVSSTNSTLTGIALDTVTGSFVANGGSVSGAAANCLDINAGAGNITYAGSIACTASRVIEVTGRTGGTITLSGNLAANGSATGINVASNTGGTVNFSGTSKTLTTTTGTAVTLATNTGATINFTGGGLAITTTSGGGFNATGGAAAITVQGSGNTITSTTGTALSLASTTLGASGLTFQSISANGAANGIVLNSTGSTGSLIVTGTGSAASGGTIQFTTGPGISLTATTNPQFNWMSIHDIARSGIDGQQVTGFTLSNSVINNVGTAAAGQYEESNVAFNDNGAFNATSLSGAVSITNNTLSNARRHGIDVENGSGTISSLTISSNSITSSTSAAVSLGTGILVLQQGSATTTSNLSTGTISGNTITNFPSGEGIAILGGSGNATNFTSATLGANGTPITISNNVISGQPAAVSHLGSNAIRASMNSQVGVMNFTISNNGTAGSPITNIQGQGVSVFAGGTITGTTTLSGNVIVANQTLGAGTQGMAVQVDDGPAATGAAAADYNFIITNNSVSNYEGTGIRAIARASLGKMDVTIQNNTVGAPILTNRNGIRIDSGSAAGDVTLCLAMSGNTSAGSGVNAGMGIRKQGTNATVNDFGIVGLSPSPTTGANAAAKVTADNPTGGGTDAISGDNFVSCSITP